MYKLNNSTISSWTILEVIPYKANFVQLVYFILVHSIILVVGSERKSYTSSIHIIWSRFELHPKTRSYTFGSIPLTCNPSSQSLILSVLGLNSTMAVHLLEDTQFPLQDTREVWSHLGKHLHSSTWIQTNTSLHHLTNFSSQMACPFSLPQSNPSWSSNASRVAVMEDLPSFLTFLRSILC